jgi:Nucleotide-sugar transporter
MRFPGPLTSAGPEQSQRDSSPDCWKLSIPAILYVIQNNLQFIAASNLDVATFQVSYQRASSAPHAFMPNPPV